jgi:uncharacterized protein (DUF427 family)
VNDYPALAVSAGHLEPSPRRVRGTVAGRTIFDTNRALYVWEIAHFPQYYIPVEDIDPLVLVDEDHTHKLHLGTAKRFGLNAGGVTRPAALRVYTDDAVKGLAGMARFEWNSLDAWYEEDEQIFVHPRSPYSRVDAVRSTRHVRVELAGVVLAESFSPVLVFETGLPTRYYLNRSEVNFDNLRPTDTVTSCPYKGTTGAYWSVVIGEVVHEDLAWSYTFPTTPVAPIAGMVAFYNEKVDITIDGVPER